MSWIRSLVAGLSPRRHEFKRRPVRVEFAVGKIALAHCFLRAVSFKRCSVLIYSSITDAILSRQLRASVSNILKNTRSYLPLWWSQYKYGSSLFLTPASVSRTWQPLD